ncbi:acyl-CoA thioesterase [Loktanella agnita]|uniref:acyl-CoA thioesterase n=1 Tax=Loktanella agnita TaxID=287097 RepID=UPI003988C48C
MDRHYCITVPFRDIDMHGHMHNAAYVSHFEAAIGHFFRVERLSGHFAPGGAYVFHVRKVEVQFHAPTRYDDIVKISCSISRLGRSSLGFALQMAGEDGALRATADIVWICVARGASAPSPIPYDLRALLEPYLIAKDPDAE